MSKSVFVEFRGQGFWAFDVVASVFLKYLVDAAVPSIADNRWLGDTVERWKVNTILPDCFGVELDENWTDAQIKEVISLIETTCSALNVRDEIAANEIQNWQLLDGERIFMRGLDVIRTKPITNFGRAIALLLRGSLPAAPTGTWWWYGTEDHPETINRQ